MKVLIGKTGRVLVAVGCRINDREQARSEGRLPRWQEPATAFELALRDAVERAIVKEVAAKIERDKSRLGAANV